MNSNLLRAEMAIRGITQGELAKIIGMSANSLSRKMNGHREFTLSEILKITEALNIKNPQSIFLPSLSQTRND